MALRSSLEKTNNVGGVEKFIDTAYDDIKKVADNLEALLALNSIISNLDGIYLGEFIITPTTRNDTSPLQSGDHYLNTSTNLLYVYVDGGWIFHAIFYTQTGLDAAIANGAYNVWIAYADDNLGTNISINPSGREWMGTVNSKNTIIVDINDPNIFTWVKIKGEIGTSGNNGDPGLDGNPGLNAYIHIAYADSADGLTNFNFVSGIYLGQLTNNTLIASNTPSDYTWVLIQGTIGNIGPPGLVDIEAPTIPANVQTFVNANTVRITWDTPPYSGHWYTKIYRALWDGITLVLFNENLLIAQAGADFIDVGLLSNQNYIYWLRHVNLDGDESALASSGAGFQIITLESPIDQFDWIDTPHLTAAITTRLDNIDSTVIDGEFGILGAYNALKILHDVLDTDHELLSSTVGGVASGLIKAHNDLQVTHDLLSTIVGDNNGGLVSISNDHTSRITLVETQATNNITRLSVLEVSTKPLIGIAWTGSQLLVQSQTLGTATFSTIITSTEDTQGILRIQLTGSDLGFHVAFNGVEITDPTGFVGPTSSAAWYNFDVDVIYDEIGVDGTNIILIWSDDLDQPTVTDVELRDSLDGTYSRLADLDTITGDNVTRLASLGTWDGNSYSVIDDLETTTSDSATKLTSLGTFAGGTYSVIDNLSTTTSDSALRLTSLGTWDGDSFALIDSYQISINGLEAHFVVKTDVNNKIAGFGLSTTTDTQGNAVSEFAVLADKFIIVNDANVNTIPFFVEAGLVFMDQAFIKELTAAKITTGTISVNDIFVGSSDVAIRGAHQGVGKGAFLVNDGANDIVTLGYLDATTIGLWIKDTIGNTIIKSGVTVADDIQNSGTTPADIGFTGDLNATLGDPFGASFNLLASDAGLEHIYTTSYLYKVVEPIVNLNLKIGDIVSFSVELKTDGGIGAINRFIIAFFDFSDIFISQISVNSPAQITIYERFSYNGVTIPLGTKSISIQVDNQPNDGNTYFAKNAMFNRGPVALPYIAPYEDSSTVGGTIGTNISEILPSTVVQDQGDGTNRNPTYGLSPDSVRDGDARTFVNAWQNIPTVLFLSGGMSYDPVGLDSTKQHIQDYSALNLTTSGFTASLKIKEIATGITTETDGDGSGTETAWHKDAAHTGPLWQAGKEDITEAWDDKYNFKFSTNILSTTWPNVNWVTVKFYTNNGGGWVERFSSLYTTTQTDKIITITIDGLTTNSGSGSEDLEFGADETTIGTGLISDVISVTWDRATAPSTVSATPAGVSDVPFIVIGNQE